MILVKDNELIINGEFSNKTLDLLWDLLNVLGPRFVFLAENLEDEELDYNYQYKVVEHNKHKIGLFNIKNRDEFDALIKLLGELCITDFFISVNAFFNNVIKSCDDTLMFSKEGFYIDEYLLEHPLTIHVEENRLRIKFDTFKASRFQLERVANRYDGKL